MLYLYAYYRLIIEQGNVHCNALHFYYSTFRLKSLKGNLKKRGKDADSILIFNHTTSQNKLLKEKVYVTDVPEAKSEFALLCRAFHHLRKMYIYSKQVKHKILLQALFTYQT